jgi:hypothetical protein
MQDARGHTKKAHVVDADLLDQLRRNGYRIFSPSAIAEDERGRNADVVAASWFTNRKRGLLAPFGVGTVDQALMSVLQVKHIFVRLFGLARPRRRFAPQPNSQARLRFNQAPSDRCSQRGR